MREQSYSNKLQNTNTQKRDFRGGETKVMKKRLNILLVFALVFSMFLPAIAAANEAEAQAELTLEQKFEALKEAGIMEGLATGEAGFDKEMTRGQLAKVLANLYDLELQPGATVPGFNEPTASEFYVQGYIQAVVKAGLMIGGPKADGTVGFRPNDNFTVQELAMVLTRALKLPVKANATVEGKTSAWATAAVAAVVEAGLFEASADYTVAAKRSLLVEAAFEIEKSIVPPVPAVLDVKEVKASGAKKVSVEFNKAVDTEKAKYEVKRGAATLTVAKTTYSDDKKVATLELASNVVDAEYTVTISGLSDEAFVKTFKGQDEKVAKIEFSSDKAPVTVSTESATLNKITEAFVTYTVTNQYNEDVTSRPIAGNLRWTASIGTISDDGKGKATIGSLLNTNVTLTQKINVTVLDSSSATFAQQTVELAPASAVDKVTIIELYNAKKETLTTTSRMSDFVLLLEAEDQYGNKIRKAADFNKSVHVTTSNPSVANIPAKDFATENHGPDNDKLGIQLLPINNGAMDGTAQIRIVSTNTGKIATFDVKVEKASEVKSIKLFQPEKVVAENEKARIPFEAFDQNGKQLKKFSELNGNISITTNNATAVTLENDTLKDEAYIQFPASTEGIYSVNVVGLKTGATSSVTIKVEKKAVPTTILSITDLKDHFVEGATYELKADKVVVEDQHGRKMDAEKVFAAGYDIEVSVTDSNVIELSGDTTFENKDHKVTVTAKSGIGVRQLKVALVKRAVDADPRKEINAKNFRMQTVEEKEVTTYKVADIKKMYNSIDEKYNVNFEVYGELTNGTKVVIPTSMYFVQSTNTKVAANGSKTKLAVANEFDSADFNKDTKELKVTVTAIVETHGGTKDVVSEVVVSNETPKVAAIKTNAKTANFEVDGDVIRIKQTHLGSDISKLYDVLKFEDQYGVDVTAGVPGANPAINIGLADAGVVISSYRRNGVNFDNVNGNGSKSAGVSFKGNTEVKDTFTMTVTASGVTKRFNVVVE
ncbi:S-layer homology domain-containing protein [Caldalkalibacillus mannanilyticus]|uniref:S-layer homology domain-containing protein n=1 Tax=Caldalkalibacillus mannanilyticus TaxID=1418 RepID=UPI000468A189|nr:S-layer homology domain-containing protein [Caldalkalibacillus mannanilyticus]